MNTIKKIERMVASIDTPEEWAQLEEVLAKYQKKWKLGAKESFTTGEVVSFISNHHRYNGKHIGILKKKNPKKASVSVQVGECRGTWTVPYSHLRKATQDDMVTMSVAKMKGK